MAGTLELAPIERTTVVDEIVNRLESLIRDRRLKPGDKLPSERELMQQLGVGRSSLREAIKALRAIGVVEVSVGEGMFVARGETSLLSKPLAWGLLLSERSVEEVIEARICVEAKLAALAAERATDDELAAIGDCLEGLRASMQAAEEYGRRDFEFHMAIARAGHNRILANVVESLRQILQMWMVEVFAAMHNRAESVADHEAMYAAIRARDPEAARRVIETTMQRGGARLLAAVARSSAGESAAATASATA